MIRVPRIFKRERVLSAAKGLGKLDFMPYINNNELK